MNNNILQSNSSLQFTVHLHVYYLIQGHRIGIYAQNLLLFPVPPSLVHKYFIIISQRWSEFHTLTNQLVNNWKILGTSKGILNYLRRCKILHWEKKVVEFMNIKTCPMHCFSFPFFLPFLSFQILALTEPSLSSILMLHRLIKVSLYKWGYRLWVLHSVIHTLGTQKVWPWIQKRYSGSTQVKSVYNLMFSQYV